MKFACPQCTQRFEADDSWPGGQFDCPTCGGVVSLPKIVVDPPVATLPSPARAAVPPSKSQLELRRWRRLKKIRQLAFGAAAACLLVAGYLFRDELLGVVRSAARTVSSAQSSLPEETAGPVALPPEAAEPELAETEPMETWVAEELVVAENEPEPVSEGPGALEWLVDNRAQWPGQVVLRESRKFPAVVQGRKAGAVMVPEGTKVDVVAIGPEEIEVRFRDGSLLLPHGATDLADLAPVIRDLAEAVPAEREKQPAQVAKTAPAADPALLAEARQIDGLIQASLAKSGQQPPAPVNDERFLRRAYLMAVGRVPTTGEAAEFLADADPHKRANLVSRLLRSPGYASQMSNWVFDRLRVVDYNNVAVIRYPAYRQWVRRAVDENMAWDAMVTQLLTAQGGGWDEQTAPVGYFTRDRGMPLDNLAITMRVFLGSRMECAQCHDDPFGDTKQKDFFRLAAFTSGLDTMKQDLFAGIYREMLDTMPLDSVENRAAIMVWRDVYGNSLAGGGTGRIALPADYQYKDARPGDIVGGRAPFGKSRSTAGTRDRDDGREKLAGWMTRGTGDRFAGMIANSMWKKVMGAGFFEPSDEYVEPAETHDPKLSAHLAKLMIQLDYNLRDYQEVLLLTEAFQAAPNPEPSVAIGGGDDFRGRRVQRMTAEQVWDSLVTLIADNPDLQPPREMDDRIFVDGRPVLEGQMTMSRLSREVLAIDDENDLRQYFMDLVAKIKAEEEGGNGDAAPAMMAAADPVGFVRVSHPRASELPSPAPRDHFLALFGQSSRDVVDGATREPNMGQVLALMNGFVQRELVGRPEVLLNRELESAASPEEKIRKLYLAILSREPSPEELSMLGEEFGHSPDTAPANIASAMLMSAEFLYVQ